MACQLGFDVTRTEALYLTESVDSGKQGFQGPSRGHGDVVVVDGALSVNRAHPTQPVIFNRLTDFGFGVHHKRPVARNWFVQGTVSVVAHSFGRWCGTQHGSYARRPSLPCLQRGEQSCDCGSETLRSSPGRDDLDI